MRVLICGAGVIGACIAYFLSRRGVAVTVVECTGVACAASGKAGGFLALDWCDGTPLEALAKRSFALHAELVEEVGGGWGYRRLATYGGSVGLGKRVNRYGLGWVAAEVAVSGQLGSTATTAQVHPGKFTAAVMQAAQSLGAELRVGQVTGIVRRKDSTRVAGVAINSELVDGDAVVIAMGPWSILAAAWLPMPAVFGLKGHSLVLETGTKIPPEALFLECREAGGAAQSPELFPRPDGTTYVCAIRAKPRCPPTPLASPPTQVRSSGCKRCAAECRRCSRARKF